MAGYDDGAGPAAVNDEEEWDELQLAAGNVNLLQHVNTMSIDGGKDETSAASPIHLPPYHEARQAIGNRLVTRPPRAELVERNIMPGGVAHPALHAATVSLGRKKVEDALSRKIQTRPTKDEVVQRNIIRGSLSSTLVAERQQALNQHHLRQHLEAHIENRPGPLDLLHSSIIEPPDGIHVDDWVKREWDSTASQHEPSVVATASSVTSPPPPPPPPLPELSPGQNAVSFDFDTSMGAPDARSMLSPGSSRRPSLYSITSPESLNWHASGGDKTLDDLSLFTLAETNLEWPGDNLSVEHSHIVREQLKKQVHEVNPVAASTGFSPMLGPVLEQFDDLARKKLELHQQLTDVQSRATLPMRSIRPRVQAVHAEAMVQAQPQPQPAAPETNQITSMQPVSSTVSGLSSAVPPIRTASGTSTGMEVDWARQLAQLQPHQQEVRKSSSHASQSGSRGSMSPSLNRTGSFKKKKKKIKSFTYHNYTGPGDKKKTKRMRSRLTQPSPNRQIVLHQQKQYLKLQELAQLQTAGSASLAMAPSGELQSPADYNAHSSTPMSFQSNFAGIDSLQPFAQRRKSSSAHALGGAPASAIRARETLHYGSMPQISVGDEPSGVNTDSSHWSTEQYSAKRSRGHQRAMSWGGRGEEVQGTERRGGSPDFGTSLPSLEIGQSSQTDARHLDSGFDPGHLDLGFLSVDGDNETAMTLDMGINMDLP